MRWLRAVFELYVEQPRLSFADCYHAIAMKRLGLKEIFTFDRDFDRLPWLTRREPPLLPAQHTMQDDAIR